MMLQMLLNMVMRVTYDATSCSYKDQLMTARHRHKLLGILGVMLFHA